MVVVSPRSRSGASDAAALGRTAAVVGRGGDVLDGPHLEAGRLQGTDRRLAARARALDEHVDLAHAVLLRPARRRLGGHLRREGGGLARALEADLARGRPRDHGTGRVGDGDDRVVERALDVRVAVGDVLLLLAAGLARRAGCGPLLRRHLPRTPVGWSAGCAPARLVCESLRGVPAGPGRARRDSRGLLAPGGLLLAGLLLAGHGALGTLAGARVGARPLAVDRQAAAVAQPRVAPDLHL